MNAWVPPALAFLGAFSGVVALYLLAADLRFGQRAQVVRRRGAERPGGAAAPQRPRVLFKDLERFRDGTTSGAADLWRRFRLIVDQSGWEVAPHTVAAGAAACALLCGGVALLLRQAWWAALLACAAGAVLPVWSLLMQRRRRIERLRRQLPEAFDIMCRAVRGGQTMASAFQLVASSSAPPLAAEFAYCCEQQNLGLEHDVSLRELANRTGVVELQIFTVALLVQRHSGGNPVELLGNLSDVVRKRMRLESRVRALTSEGRMQAWVLSLLPVAAFAGVYVLDRDYAAILLDRPRVLVATAAAVLLGILWIRRIIRIDY